MDQNATRWETKPRHDPAKEALWRTAVVEQRRSGQTVRAVCQSRGLTEPSFYAWRAELVRRDQRRRAAKGSADGHRPRRTVAHSARSRSGGSAETLRWLGRDEVLASAVVHPDDMPVDVRNAHRKEQHTARFWDYVGDDAQRLVRFGYTPSRKRDGPAPSRRSNPRVLRRSAHDVFRRTLTKQPRFPQPIERPGRERCHNKAWGVPRNQGNQRLSGPLGASMSGRPFWYPAD